MVETLKGFLLDQGWFVFVLVAGVVLALVIAPMMVNYFGGEKPSTTSKDPGSKKDKKPAAYSGTKDESG